MPPALPQQRPSRESIRRARTDLAEFGLITGYPMEPWQAASLRLGRRHTVLVSPRQCGKSRSLAVLACWWAFRRPKQVVLVISAGETAALRLLAAIRDVASHPLLAASIDDETKTRVLLSNGSQIQSVPASDAQVRGWSVDLLIVDEAAFVPDDLLASAALPTTAARPAARIVLASTPWGDAGMFWDMAQAGLAGSKVTDAFRWKLADAWWISPEAIEAARQTLSPLRFRAEYEGEWVASGDAYFSRDDLLAAVADFALAREGAGEPAYAGLDWGRQQDAHAVAIAGLLDDYGANGRPVIIVPWAETSQRHYHQQTGEIVTLTLSRQLTILSETNGVGASPTEDVTRLAPRARVIPVASTQASKENAYGRVATLLAERSCVLPQHEELLRQMGGVAAKPTPSGGLRIGARQESIHDDLPDALSLAIAGLPRQLADVGRRDAPEGTQWLETPGGTRVPLPVRLLAAEASYLQVYGALTCCAGCGRYYRSASAGCSWCGVPNPVTPSRPVTRNAVTAPRSEPVPVAGGWASAYLPPDPRRCTAGHIYAGAHGDNCPRCSGRGAGPRSMTPQGVMPGLAGLLRGFPGRH